MGRNKNLEAVIQICLLLMIACLLFAVMVSGKISNYIHPRFYFGLWISIIILLLFAGSLFSKIKKARHNVNIRHYFIFMIPIAAALLFPAAGVNNKDMTVAAGSAAGETGQQTESLAGSGQTSSDYTESSLFGNTGANYGASDDLSSSAAADTSSWDTQETAAADDAKEETISMSEKYAPYETDGILYITDDIFADWYCDVYDYLDEFVGKKCSYLAQVYSMDDFKEDQFLAGRYFMVCCAADLVGYGIICESDRRGELTDDEWITVTGTIASCEYNGYMVPLLTDVTITDGEEPEVAYIYYNSY
ncbi:MAG TPA: TIGR03943 family protein [Lachnospiraceae bacterium]|nr:TIGR03943 family protein [Lachnospiraceae bacterium]